MYSERVTTARVTEQKQGQRTEKPDLLATEEPLEIRLVFGPEGNRAERAIAVTMRTPGHDFELALGFLFTEGIISKGSQILNIMHCEQVKNKEEQGNVVRVSLLPNVFVDWDKLSRNFYASSSCGVCGKSSIEGLSFYCEKINTDLSISKGSLLEAPELMQKEQDVFKYTGGLHASALFNPKGQLQILREDIGRHNALDKLIGFCLSKNQLPLHNSFVVVSGRLGFELVQKSVAAGIPILGAVGAPSSLAVKLAKSYGLTLAGFVRNGSFNLYSGEERIQ